MALRISGGETIFWE